MKSEVICREKLSNYLIHMWTGPDRISQEENKRGRRCNFLSL
jgi:hypothetical protein